MGVDIMGKKYGFSFSWKRASGISGMKNKISRTTGIPTTKSGRQRKMGKTMGCMIYMVGIILIVAILLIMILQ
jgi:hypothetical protein